MVAVTRAAGGEPSARLHETCRRAPTAFEDAALPHIHASASLSPAVPGVEECDPGPRGPGLLVPATIALCRAHAQGRKQGRKRDSASRDDARQPTLVEFRRADSGTRHH